MLDCPDLAVEIWHYILLAVIDVPYVLDTLIETKSALWNNSDRYHNHDVYAKSELQRKTLRLVCSSWWTFADEYRYRWITYDSHPDADTRMHKEAVEAIELASTSVDEGANMTCKPRRITFQVSNDEDMGLFRKTIDHCSMKLTTLFVECFYEYEDEICEYVVFHSSKLPMLQCLSLPPPNRPPLPLRALSSAFPKLLAFGTPGETPFSFFPDEGDILTLPELVDLELDLSRCKEMALKRWHLPRMINLTTVIDENFIGGGGLNTIRALGANLSYLDICAVLAPIRLPAEFWSWCPRLVELSAFFAWVFLDSPAPASHPLKYVAHWPYYDSTDNPLIMEALDPTRLHSLQLLPPSVELFVVRKKWEDQLDLLTINHYSQIEQERVMVRMKDICAESSIRIEDEDGVALEVFLASQGIGQGRIDSIDPNAVEPTES